MRQDSIVHFYKMIPEGFPPVLADRSGGGTLPVRAYRYCEAVTTATAFGWWVFPPTDLDLLWDGQDVFWRSKDTEHWVPLFRSAQFPGQAARFDLAAPDAMRGCSPPFLSALADSGVVQIWTGLLVRSAPEWSLLVRAPANIPLPGGYTIYEGMLESDRRFGPLFTNVRLTRSDKPVHISADRPIVQVQPIPRNAYSDPVLQAMDLTLDMNGMGPEDWAAYRTSIIEPSDDPNRCPGRYAMAARRRRKQDSCPAKLLRRGEQRLSADAV